MTCAGSAARRSSRGTFSHARDLVGLLDELELDSTSLVGGSMGAQLRSRLPLHSRIGSRSSCSWTPACPDMPGQRRRRPAGPKRKLLRARRSRSRGRGEPADVGRRPAPVGGRGRSGAESAGWRDAAPCVRSPVARRRRCEEEPLVPDLADRIGEVQAPTLVVIGEEDAPDIHAIADRLVREIPDARRASIPGSARREPRAPGRVRPHRPRIPLMTALEPVELVDRIWARDPTIWTGTDEAHWLGWLDEPARMLERVEELEALPRDFDDVVLLGMGGSSLAPEVIRRTFGDLRLPRPRHDPSLGDSPARGAGRARPHALRRRLEVGDDSRDPLPARLLPRSGWDVRRDHGPGHRAGAAREGTGLRVGRERRADDRRALLRPLAVRHGARGADGPRGRRLARARRGDGSAVPAR